MPEGDTIYRAAGQLRSAFEGTIIVDAHQELTNERAIDLSHLEGHPVRAVESRGKHLFIHFSTQEILHTHLGMTGAWRVFGLEATWGKPAWQAWVALSNKDSTCVCFSPKTCELISVAKLRRDPYLSRLGPDLLSAHCNLDEALDRLCSRPELPVGEAVMNQTLVSGIGNVYKSEVLFLCEQEPFELVGNLPREQLRRILEKASALLKRNVGRGMRKTRFGLDGSRQWVYGRAKEHCMKCGQPILIRRQGTLGRTTFWCPQCQRSRDASP